MPNKDYISNSVIRRLPRYYRFLGQLQKEGTTKISSAELSARMKLTASQIRQDLNCFGGFGQQGYGYNVDILRREVGVIIGVERKIKTVLIGAGNLGKAFASYFDFPKYGCELVGIFDIDPQLVGAEIAGIPIDNMTKLTAFCAGENPEIAVLCIPKNSAAEVCEMLVENGVKAFLNFSHYDINLHFDGIITENVHMGDSLLTLVYNVNNRGK
ncbi:MAG: redox-sensing transcriptional repressor Rex [Oscillospiraceae bacterium]|jgi:redox-sensing transcriptional repressor|nr:redox-sensing transcriptional repressor Rex [Oscillospiraceae bacterium]